MNFPIRKKKLKTLIGKLNVALYERKLQRYDLRSLEDFKGIISRKDRKLLFDPRKFMNCSQEFQQYVLNLIFICNQEGSPLYYVSKDVLLYQIVPFIDEKEVFVDFNRILQPAIRMKERKNQKKNKDKDEDNDFETKKKEHFQLLDDILSIESNQEVMYRLMEICEVVCVFSKYTGLDYNQKKMKSLHTTPQLNKHDCGVLLDRMILLIDKLWNIPLSEKVELYGPETSWDVVDELNKKNKSYFFHCWSVKESSTTQEKSNRNLLVKVMRNICIVIDRIQAVHSKGIPHSEEKRKILVFEDQMNSLFIQRLKLLTTKNESEENRERYFKVCLLFFEFGRLAKKKQSRNYYRTFNILSEFAHSDLFFPSFLYFMKHYHPTHNKNLFYINHHHDPRLIDSVSGIYKRYLIEKKTTYDVIVPERDEEGEETLWDRKDSYKQIISKTVFDYFDSLYESFTKFDQFNWLEYDIFIIIYLLNKKRRLNYFETILQIVSVFRPMMTRYFQKISQEEGEISKVNEYVQLGVEHVFHIFHIYRDEADKVQKLKEIMLVDFFKHFPLQILTGTVRFLTKNVNHGRPFTDLLLSLVNQNEEFSVSVFKGLVDMFTSDKNNESVVHKIIKFLEEMSMCSYSEEEEDTFYVDIIRKRAGSNLLWLQDSSSLCNKMSRIFNFMKGVQKFMRTKIITKLRQEELKKMEELLESIHVTIERSSFFHHLLKKKIESGTVNIHSRRRMNVVNEVRIFLGLKDYIDKKKNDESNILFFKFYDRMKYFMDEVFQYKNKKQPKKKSVRRRKTRRKKKKKKDLHKRHQEYLRSVFLEKKREEFSTIVVFFLSQRSCQINMIRNLVRKKVIGRFMDGYILESKNNEAVEEVKRMKERFCSFFNDDKKKE